MSGGTATLTLRKVGELERDAQRWSGRKATASDVDWQHNACRTATWANERADAAATSSDHRVPPPHPVGCL